MKKLLCLLAIIITVFALNVSALAADTALSFVTETLPDAAANAYYEQQIEVTGGDGNYTFSTPDLADFPDGVTLSEDGLISGTPTVGEITYCNMTIVVTDGEGNRAEKIYTLKITARQVIFKVLQNNFFYDGQPHTVTVDTYIINEEDEEVPVSGISYNITYNNQTSQTVVGNYPIKIRVTTPGYVFGSADQKYMYIEQNPYTSVSFTGNSFGYDGQAKSPAISVKGKYTADSAEMELAYTTVYEGINGTVYAASSDAPVLPGEYRVSCRITDTNFATPLANNTTFEILPVTVDFTLDDMSSYYVADPWSRTYEPSVAAATDYTVTYVKGSAEYDEPSELGAYTVRIAFPEGSVYTVGTITPPTVTALQKPVNFTITDNRQMYSGQDMFPTISNDCGLTEAAGYTVEYYKDENKTTPRDVGEYKITITITNPDYVFGSQDQDYMYIEQNANVSISFDGSSFLYDGQAKSPSISVKGKYTESSEETELGYTVLYEGIGETDYPASSDAPVLPGEYSVTCTVTDTNFVTPAQNSATFEIVTGSVNFELNDKSDFYATDTWDRVYEPSVASVTGYTVKYIKDEVFYDAPTGSGEYTVQITFEEGSAYTVGTITPPTVTVLQKPVNFTITNNRQMYSGQDMFPTIADDCGLTETAGYTVEYYKDENKTTPIDVGEYKITITITNPDYVFGSQDQEYMYIVQNTNVSISFDGSSFLYDGQAKSPTISVKGKYTADSAEMELTYTKIYEGIGETDYPASSDAPVLPGEYSVTCTVTDTNFATPAQNSATFKILSNVVDFELNDKSDYYVADTWERTYEPSVAEATDYTVKYIKNEASFNTPTEPGEYTVQIAFEEGSAYVVGTITPPTVTALQKPVDFTITNTSQEYTGTALYPIIGNNCGLSETTDYTVVYYRDDEVATPVEAGEYTITISITNPHYVYNSQDETIFTINAPVDLTEFTLDDGNSVFARINADGGDTDAAKQSFEQNFTYNSIVYPPQAWADTNLDMDEKALFVYNGQEITLPSVSAVDSDGQAAEVKTVLETEDGETDLTGEGSYTADLPCGIYTIRYSIEGNTLTEERKLVVLWQLGDVNLDKNVNSIDGNYIKNNADIPEATADERLFKYRVCDVNKDGIVDDGDTNAIYVRFNQKITEYYR